jgi:hypothetical protein
VYRRVVRWLVLAIALVGCYSDPDYNGTRFRCDDDRGCPPGQTCVAGFCEGGGGGGDGVVCGSDTCGAGDQCCADFISGVPVCIPVTASCNGFGATCDGVEDCDGNPCCQNGSSVACGIDCGDRACLQPADCPASEPMCCFDLGTGEPWGRCLQACP